MSLPPIALVVKKAEIGTKIPHSTGTKNKWTPKMSRLNTLAKTTLRAAWKWSPRNISYRDERIGLLGDVRVKGSKLW